MGPTDFTLPQQRHTNHYLSNFYVNLSRQLFQPKDKEKARDFPEKESIYHQKRWRNECGLPTYSNPDVRAFASSIYKVTDKELL